MPQVALTTEQHAEIIGRAMHNIQRSLQQRLIDRSGLQWVTAVSWCWAVQHKITRGLISVI